MLFCSFFMYRCCYCVFLLFSYIVGYFATFVRIQLWTLKHSMFGLFGFAFHFQSIQTFNTVINFQPVRNYERTVFIFDQRLMHRELYIPNGQCLRSTHCTEFHFDDTEWMSNKNNTQHLRLSNWVIWSKAIKLSEIQKRMFHLHRSQWKKLPASILLSLVFTFNSIRWYSADWFIVNARQREPEETLNIYAATSSTRNRFEMSLRLTNC